ncbi:hypothetical protein BD770DRAFT_342577 [Pilaira anomala]|nr:hypothetical protein BD770DRAFT_342577 [Pilaira anomala]
MIFLLLLSWLLRDRNDAKKSVPDTSIYYHFSITSFTITFTKKKMASGWVYASGSAWVSFDEATQKLIETLWRSDQATWINSQSFRGPVYVDTSEMVVLYGSYSYTIARVSS